MPEEVRIGIPRDKHSENNYFSLSECKTYFFTVVFMLSTEHTIYLIYMLFLPRKNSHIDMGCVQLNRV